MSITQPPSWQYFIDGEYLAYAQSTLWSDAPMPVLGFKIKEELFEPYEIEATLVLKGPLDQAMLGETICVGLGGESAALRTFTGLLGKFEYQNAIGTSDNLQYVYKVWLYPPLWQLKFDARLRIFEQLEKRTVITQILQTAQIDINSGLVNTNNLFETNTQYNENTLDYIIRLMQECGVIAYFDASNLICDDPSQGVIYSYTLPQYCLSENWTSANTLALNFKQLQIGALDFASILTFSLINDSIGNTFAIYDYNFETPETPTTASTQSGSWIPSIQEIYPLSNTTTPQTTNSAQASASSTKSLNSLQTHQLRFVTETTAYNAYPGTILTLDQCNNTNINGDYYIEEVEHILEFVDNAWQYRNIIKGVAATTTYMPAKTKQKPHIHGNQTAVVMGTTENTQVNVDSFGRIQVRFMWVHGDSADDISNNISQQSSAWVRVMQWGAAGNSWGNVSLPRVGQEVVVGFINGDPDYPIILGSVFNAANTFPKTMPDNAPTLVIKTNTMGDAGKLGLRYNELRMEDTELDELVYLRAQNNAQFEILNDFIKSISGNEVETITGDVMRTITTGNRYERIGASQVMPGDVTIGTEIAATALNDAIDMLTIKKGIKILHIDTGVYATIIDSGDMTISVPKGGYNMLVDLYTVITRGLATVSIGGAYITRVSGDHTLSVNGDCNTSVDGLYSLSVKGVSSTSVVGEYSMSSEGAMSIDSNALNIAASLDVSIEAGGVLSLKGATVNIEAGEVSITGGMVSASSGAVFEISAGGMVNISGAMIQLN